MKDPVVIKFVKPPNHISEFLTHWAGRSCKTPEEAFNVLSKIIKTGKLKLSSCPMGYSNDAEIKLSVPMMCFTETPIEHSFEHCDRFGKFGIGFNKNELIKIGANPVLYIVDARKEYQIGFSDIYWNKLNQHWDSGTAQTEIPLEIRNNLSWFLATTQPYTDNLNGKYKEYYPQREWRIIRLLPSNLTKNEFKKWGEINDGFDINKIDYEDEDREINGVITKVPVGYLSFDKSSIMNIIVPKTFKSEAEQLRVDGGLLDCDIFVLDDD